MNDEQRLPSQAQLSDCIRALKSGQRVMQLWPARRRQYVQELRDEGWTYQAIADEVGVSRQRVQQWETATTATKEER